MRLLSSEFDIEKELEFIYVWNFNSFVFLLHFICLLFLPRNYLFIFLNILVEGVQRFDRDLSSLSSLPTFRHTSLS
jgi:hypothetical protein